jgi:nucleotide-binding universal stress UspA family protein
MSTIKKILIPFDFTEPAIGALEYGLKFVGYQRAIAIEAIYASKAATSTADAEEARENFNAIVASLNHKTMLPPALTIAQGGLTETILSERNKEQADLIIMGTMGDTSADEPVTNTSKLVLEADCPVLTVPYGGELDTPKEIALVLGKETIEHPTVLATLLDVSRMFNAKVHVLTIYKDSIYDEAVVVEDNEETLAYYLEHFYAEHTFEKNQDIEKGILEYIAEKNIDLLAIIPRNHADKTQPSEGRLTKLLTLHSKVPVLSLD